MRVVLEVRAAARCKTCSFLTPVAGLRHETTCASCAAPIDIAGRTRAGRDGGLTYTFGGYYDAVAEALLYDDDHALQDARDSQGMPFELRVVKQIACACGAPLGSPPPSGAKDVRCSKCGDATPVRWPDARTNDWDPRVTYLIGDAGDRGVALAQKMEGTVVGCGSCGGPLEQRGKRRVLVCGHCRAENFLSDAIWTKLFPRPEDHVFYMVYELDEDAHADAITFLVTTEHYFFNKKKKKELIEQLDEKMKERVVAARAKRAIVNHKDAIDADVGRILVAHTGLAHSTIVSIDKRLDDDVRMQIAKLATRAFVSLWVQSKQQATRMAGASVATGEELERCAQDEDAKVRAEVAKRTDAPAELIAALRKDSNEKVRDHARANTSYQPGFFTKLLGG